MIPPHRKPPFQFGLASLFWLMAVAALIASLIRWRFWPGWYEIAWPMLKSALLWVGIASAGYLGLELAKWCVRTLLKNPWDSV